MTAWQKIEHDIKKESGKNMRNLKEKAKIRRV